MTPIVLQVDLLRSGRLGELTSGQGRAVDQIGRCLDRTMLLLQDVLDSSRIRAGSLQLHLDTMDLNEMIEEVVAAFRDQAQHAGVTIEFLRSDPIHLRVDRHRILQVITNLLTNAIKFTPPGGRVRLDAGGDQDHAQLVVEDTGRGFADGETLHLFQPFVQTGERLPSSPGNGLGLYITRGIVTAHAGEIGVFSAGQGKGTRFWVRLPRNGPPAVSRSF